MSDYLAVAGVSAVLRSLLTTALTSGGPSSLLGGVPGNAITVTSPDLITTGPDEQIQLNIFMYYASLNPSLRNEGLASTNAQGTKLSNPPLALNLHYLVSAYGAKEFDPEILLGWAMQVFHETPVVSRAMIQSALNGLLASSAPEAKLVAVSTLANQTEHIRITPEALTTEEIYRLWTAFQTSYRPTTSYQVSVVVIQSTDAYTSNLPVQKRKLIALPIQTPAISQVSPPMILAGQVLTLSGSNFLGDSAADTLVSFDGGAGNTADSVQGNTVHITLPATLQAGTHGVRVLRQVTFPDETTSRPGFSSNEVGFQLLPTIQGASPFTASRGTSLSLTLSPPVGSTQKVVLYIGDTGIPIDDRPATAATLVFPLPTTLSLGLFPLRVEVDTAQSQLTSTPAGFTPQLQVNP